MAAREFHQAQALSNQSTTSTTLVDALTLTFTPTASTKYYILWSGAAKTSSTQAEEVTCLNTTSSTTFNDQKFTGTHTAKVGGIGAQSFGAGPASQTYKVQYDNLAAGTANLQDLNLIALAAAATDLDVETAGPITFTNTTFANVTGGASLTVGAGTWLILAAAEIGIGSTTANLGIQLTDGTNNYGAITNGSTVATNADRAGWMTAVKVTLGGNTTYNFQTLVANAQTGAVAHMAIVALDLSKFDNTYEGENRTRTTATGISYTTQTTLSVTPPAASLNHLIIHAFGVDVATGLTEARGTLGGSVEWVSEQGVQTTPTAPPEHKSKFGFYVASLVSGATAITNDYANSATNVTGCAESAIAALQLDATPYVSPRWRSFNPLVRASSW